MKATLVYNSDAGQNGEDQVDELKEAIREAGYEPVYKPSEKEEDLDSILKDVEGLVISAGGDGTARAIITRIVNRDNVYFTPLPMGTANNLCRSLGIEGDPLEIIRGLHSPQTMELDVGCIQAPWGDNYFIEGAGVGFFAEVLASYQPEKEKSTMRGIESLIEILQNGFSREWVLEFEDKTVQDKFLLVEALNTKAVGPHLKFAPDADPTDGLLSIVCINEGDQEGYLNYLEGILSEDMVKFDSVEVFNVSEVTIHWHGYPVHTDAKVYPPDFDYYPESEKSNGISLMNAIRPYPDVPKDAKIRFSLLPTSLNLWLPAEEE